MSTALAVPEAPAVTSEQLELIKRTVANGATADELKLYLFDCARQGVHPLDKLVHFTKRKGKYTPITSIDFMRIRAAETNEYAGNDDAVFGNTGNQPGLLPEWATVTVWRLVQGTRCSFTATARWAEYYPGDGDNGFMWRKMPHTMLGKCSEALALRKGFPRQLAGLYAREEMDQADGPRNSGYVVEAPAQAPAAIPATAGSEREKPSEPNGGASAATLPPGVVYITKVDKAEREGAIKGWLHTSAQLPGTDGVGIFDDRMLGLAAECCQNRTPVRVTFKTSGTSRKDYVKDIVRDKPPLPSIDINEDLRDNRPAILTAADIPFLWLLPLLLSVSACL